jgi:predicted CXXCH cytochrome family protein
MIPLLLIAALLGAGKPDFKLKRGAEGANCLVCHNQFQEQLAKHFVHTPVKSKQCTGCHNPHAAEHGKLLDADRNRVCLTCHAEVVPAQARSEHKPVAEGKCVLCHDPHASSNQNQLLKAGAALCAGCHQQLADGAAKAKFPHAPLQKSGCVACHEPHGSAKASKLLKADVPALCVSCHKPSQPAFVKAHMSYPVGSKRCTSCHDPHGSNQPGMLYDTVHKPVLARDCAQCHELASSATPFATRRRGMDLCRGCHAEKVVQMLDKSAVHQPVIDRTSCLNCHSPHASAQKGLLKGPMLQVCGSCHADTLARQENSPAKHRPVAQGDCNSCHDPHATSAPLLLADKLKLVSCGPCHENMQHSSHPLGPKYTDPRNRNLTLNCLSCHRAHGTEYAHMIPYAKTNDLCTKCHQKFAR